MLRYANDTTFYSTMENNTNSDCSTSVLENIAQWSQTNYLKLSLEKATYMIMASKNGKENAVVGLGDSTLERTDSYKCLDIYVGDKVSFEEHGDHIISKANSYRKQKLCDVNKVDLYLYFSMVQPIFHYGSKV